VAVAAPPTPLGRCCPGHRGCPVNGAAHLGPDSAASAPRRRRRWTEVTTTSRGSGAR
jgi:hypothetical protein